MGRHSHPSPQWCSPTFSARSGPDPLGGYCHPSHSGQQTGDSPCGLPFAFPLTHRNGPDRLFWQGTGGLDGRRTQQQTRGLELKVHKAPDLNDIPNRALKHLPQQAVSLLVQIFNAVLPTHHFPSMWKHAKVISLLKPGKDPALPSSYRPISLLDTIGKLFEKILLHKILNVVSKRGLMRDEQFGFRPRQSTPFSWPASLKE